MSMFPGTRRAELDYGTDNRAVAAFFNTVYAWMAVGLAVTAGVAWFASQNLGSIIGLYGNGMIVVMLLGAVGVAWGVRAMAGRLNPTVATGLFLVYAALIGVAIAPIFLIYNISTIGAAFLMTGGVFGVMSLYGFITKRDLTSIGSFLIMGAVGLFIASIVNVFLASSVLSWVITYAVLGVFMGLTAFETQQLRHTALELAHDPRAAASYAIVGSLNLYISFINMFMSILRILGDRR